MTVFDTSGDPYDEIARLDREFDRLSASHDRLLAAAKDTMEVIKDGGIVPFASYYFHLLKAAIAAAEEKVP